LLSRLAENPEETFSAEARSQPATGGLAPVRGAVSAESARRLDASADQVEALTRFLEECLRHASRAVLLVERHGRAQPWKSPGFSLPRSSCTTRTRSPKVAKGEPSPRDSGTTSIGAAGSTKKGCLPRCARAPTTISRS